MSWVRICHMFNDDEVEESAVAKSIGKQDERNVVTKDSVLFNVLSSKRKVSKSEAEYREPKVGSRHDMDCICAVCKFNSATKKSVK